MAVLPFAVGDDVVHLDLGLARVTAIKDTVAGLQIAIHIAADGRDLMVPACNWAETLHAMPTRAEVSAWSVPRRPARRGWSLALVRLGALQHRNFADQVTALRDAYACGDRSGLATEVIESLERRLLPIAAAATERTVAALRAELRAAIHPDIVAEIAAIPALAWYLVPVGRFTLGARTQAGNRGNRPIRLATVPGTWFMYDWTTPAGNHIVALHADHIVAWRSRLLACAKLKPTGVAGERDSELGFDDHGIVELTEPRWRSNLTDRLHLAVTTDADAIACVVFGKPLDFLARRLLVDDDLAAAAVTTVRGWLQRRVTSSDLSRALFALLELPTLPGPALIPLLERVVAIGGDKAPYDCDRAVELLAAIDDPMRWLSWIDLRVARADRHLACCTVTAITRGNQRELGEAVLARLVNDEPGWNRAREPLLAALAAGGYAGVPAA